LNLAAIEKFPTVDMSKLEATLTAEAVKQEFESAMKEFEALGADLISAAKKLRGARYRCAEHRP
jgi:hypothetical protein